MPWFRLKSGFGEQFNLRGTVFCAGEPLLVDDTALADKCRTLGYFDEVEPIDDDAETKASPCLFDAISDGFTEAASVANDISASADERSNWLANNADKIIPVGGTNYKKKRRR